MKSVSIVSTPLQLINAVEYIQYSQCKHNTLIIDGRTVSRNIQLKSLLQFSIYKNVFDHVFCTNISGFRFFFIDLIYSKLLLLFLVRFHKYDKYIVGNYHSLLHKYLINKGKQIRGISQIVVVDDGMVSLSYPRIRQQECQSGICDKSYEGGRLLKIVFYNKFKYIPHTAIVFFSCYNLQFFTDDKLIANNWRYFSNNYQHTEKSYDFQIYDKIIVGQPFIQLKILSENNYRSVISRIVGNTDVSKVLYVSHPAENEYPFSCLGINIIKIPFPIECMVKLIKPSSEVFGVASSALINIKLLNPTMKVVACDISSLISKGSDFWGTLQSIYLSFKENKIELMSIISILR